MDHDVLATMAVEALRILGTSDDDDKRESYLRSLLVLVYQAGQIDANDRHLQIRRTLHAKKVTHP